MTIEEQLTALPDVRVQRDVPLSAVTTWRIGGPAKVLALVTTRDALVATVNCCRAMGTRFVILGGGSNVLFPDAGYDGVVIRVMANSMAFADVVVHADAGVVYAALATQSAKRGLSGLEFAATIPGTVGGAVRGNAGAWGGETKDVVTDVEVLTTSGTVVHRSNAECAFGYRESAFKHSGEIVLGATFHLHAGDPETIVATIRRFQGTKRDHQPLDAPAAGSTFKNVPVASIDPALFERYQMERVRKDDVVPVGYLIEQTGLKGFRIGGIRVSEKHANFLLNDGTATAEQVVQLISVIKQKVRTTFGGLQIELEVHLVDL